MPTSQRLMCIALFWNRDNIVASNQALALGTIITARLNNPITSEIYIIGRTASVGHPFHRDRGISLFSIGQSGIVLSVIANITTTVF